MAEEKFAESARKRPSMIVSLPIELYNKRVKKMEQKSSRPISCPIVTSTTGYYYGKHLSEQPFPDGTSDFKELNYTERKDITDMQQNIPDKKPGEHTVKEERVEKLEYN